MALTETNGIVEEATEEEMMDAAARADLTGMGHSTLPCSCTYRVAIGDKTSNCTLHQTWMVTH